MIFGLRSDPNWSFKQAVQFCLGERLLFVTVADGVLAAQFSGFQLIVDRNAPIRRALNDLAQVLKVAVDHADGQPDLFRWQFSGAGHDFIAGGIAVSGAFAPAFRQLVKRCAKTRGIRLPDQAHVADPRQRRKQANKALILAQGLFLDAFAALHIVHA